MKIALLTDGIYPYVIGGMQRHSFYLAKYLAANGIQIDLYHTNRSELDIAELELFTTEEKQMITSFVIPFPEMGSAPGHYIKESYQYSKEIWKIFKQRSQPDFVYVKGFAGWELINQKRNGVKLPPVAINFHGYEMFQKAPSWRMALSARFLLRSPVLFNIKNADRVVSYGSKITGIIQRLGILSENIIELPTGIDPDWLRGDATKTGAVKKFVFVGRNERRKGVRELNWAIRKLLEQKREFEFHFIGPVDQKEKIRDPKLIYHGEVKEDKQMKSLLDTFDILVCPSHAEGMPNVILEAMARGLAVVASDTGAVSLMVNEENGWLIEPGVREVLHLTLENVLASTDLNIKKERSLEKVKRSFLWPDIILKTIAEIEKNIQRLNSNGKGTNG